MTDFRPRIALVAGESSGDMLGAHLIKALKKIYPDAYFFGIGGPKMQALGFESLWPMEKLTVFGYLDALKRYREITGIRRALFKRLAKPDVFIGVDAPDFNFWLEEKLKKTGVPAIHFVSPSIWAWRGERIKKIAKSVSRMLAMFPFEPPLYESKGIPVSYVGHPLADIYPLEVKREIFREKLGLEDVKGPVVALLPGSRVSELKFLAEAFVAAAKLVAKRFPDAVFLVPLVSRDTRNLFEEALYKLGAQDLACRLLYGHAADAMAASDVVLIASGTATLEAALLKRPMVIAYKLAPFDWKRIQKKRYQPWIGLPNVLAGKFIVPEFLQDDATPENLAQAVINFLLDSRLSRQLSEQFLAIHHCLRQNTAEQAALAIAKYLP